MRRSEVWLMHALLVCYLSDRRLPAALAPRLAQLRDEMGFFLEVDARGGKAISYEVQADPAS